MSNYVRLTDNIGVLAVEQCDYPDEYHESTVSVNNLKRAANILDELGWENVDVNFAPPQSETADNPLVVLRPSGQAFFVEGEQPAVSIAPRIEKGGKR